MFRTLEAVVVVVVVVVALTPGTWPPAVPQCPRGTTLGGSDTPHPLHHPNLKIHHPNFENSSSKPLKLIIQTFKTHHPNLKIHHTKCERFGQKRKTQIMLFLLAKNLVFFYFSNASHCGKGIFVFSIVSHVRYHRFCCFSNVSHFRRCFYFSNISDFGGSSSSSSRRPWLLGFDHQQCPSAQEEQIWGRPTLTLLIQTSNTY